MRMRPKAGAWLLLDAWSFARVPPRAAFQEHVMRETG